MIECLTLLLAVLRAAVCDRSDLLTENLLLRHQLAVLPRPARRRPRLRKTGCRRLRRCLFCGVLSARQWGPELRALRAFDVRLLACGKPKKVALVAVLHTLRRLKGRLRAFRYGPRTNEQARAQGPTASQALAPAVAA